jgi:hypothetical protein
VDASFAGTTAIAASVVIGSLLFTVGTLVRFGSGRPGDPGGVSTSSTTGFFGIDGVVRIRFWLGERHVAFDASGSDATAPERPQ